MQIVQVIKNVENIDDEYIEKLQELVLFYWEYKDNNPDIVLAEAQLGVCNLNLNGNSQRTRLRHVKQNGGKRVADQSSHSVTNLLQIVTIYLLFISQKFSNLYCKLIKELYEF